MDFNRIMLKRGWVTFENFVPNEIVEGLRNDLASATENCARIQKQNGLDNMDNTTHHLIGQGESFLEYLILFEELDPFTEAYFGGKYILNSFGGNTLKKGISYAGSIHRDIRSYSAHLPLMLNTIVMLDDFTVENGATEFLHRGHVLADKPDEDHFNVSSFPILGKAGDVVFFNSNTWHRAGINKTNKPRRSLTPMFSRPFIKQQFDYTQFCNEDSSPWLKQILGYNSRTPATLSEWYQPKENRFYKDGQG